MPDNIIRDIILLFIVIVLSIHISIRLNYIEKNITNICSPADK